MEKPISQKRYIESKKSFFLFWVLFIALFYWFFYYYKPVNLTGTSSVYNYFSKYGIYVPLTIGIISIVKSYLLLFTFYVLRINCLITKILAYVLIYGFWLFFAIQLRYSEPRYTDIAIVLIDGYSLPLLLASSITLIGVFFWSIFKKK